MTACRFEQPTRPLIRTLDLVPAADTQFDALGKYGIDLTAKAAELDPVIGRDEEIRWDSPQGWR